MLIPKISDGKTRPASTGTAGIRIRKSKSPVVKSVLPVYPHTEKIKLMGLIHDTFNTPDHEMTVIFFWVVKSQYIGHTRTSASLHPDPEFLSIIKPFRIHQFPDLPDGSIC